MPTTTSAKPTITTASTKAESPPYSITDSEEVALKKQYQYRLFLLKHASDCTAKSGKCKHLYCPEMKDLLRHMACCNDTSCNVAHCVTSRKMINHYHNCEDEECEMCEPVKETLIDEYWEGTRRRLSFTEKPREGGSKQRKPKM